MRKLSLIIGILVVAINAFSQSPHGDLLKIDCSDCHSTEGWTYAVNAAFKHEITGFNLEGQHQFIDCRSCHSSMIFNEVKTNCVDCHSDIHNNMLGLDCSRCHTAESWIISNVTELHQQSRFPLVGAHRSADCSDCHLSSSLMEFRPLGIECVDCHRTDYDQTSNPNHATANMSLDCNECHLMSSMEWSATGIDHSFFPLEKGHQIYNCTECHTDGSYANLSTDCYSCHQQNFDNSMNPPHNVLGFSTICEDCHTLDPGWKPAEFLEHDVQYFPIYSGEHKGEWEQCAECHTQANSFTFFSCTDCHEHNQSDMNEEHQGVNAYSYNSFSCFACHPRGGTDEVFDHNSTSFPLLGQHRNATCLDCHTEGLGVISVECADCHTSNYNESSDPRHLEAGISLECKDCHNENGWQPSSFNHSITANFDLTNGHALSQCSDCHLGTTSDAVNDCFTCHDANYNDALDHLSLNFPHDCLQCHNTTDWNDATFDHNTTDFPLTGAHIATNCIDCHSSGYIGLSTNCSSCHQSNYDQTSNPNHSSMGLSVSCDDCHSTTDWEPAAFPEHNAFYSLNGAHASISTNCYLCHSGNYISTPNTCYACHTNDYNNTTDPSHIVAGFPIDCASCHSEIAWEPATFDHDGQYFPIYSGEHNGEWNKCSDCHTVANTYSLFSCIDCHEHNKTDMDDEHKDVPDYVWRSLDCLSCHPRGKAE